jgi:hypothetical protein
MKHYTQGKVYKLVGAGKVYVGSTTVDLKKRFAKHKEHYSSWLKGKYGGYCSAFECLADPNCSIELLELCPSDADDFTGRIISECEAKWIRETEGCVNIKKGSSWDKKGKSPVPTFS